MIKGMTLSNRGNKLSLLLGLCFGLLAAIGVVVLLSGGSDKSFPGDSGATVQVVVAGRAIASGTKVTPQMLTLKNVTEAEVLQGAFNNTDAVVNQVTTVPIVAGEQIITSKVTGSAQSIAEFGANPPLTLVVPEGMRGVSVEVSSLIGAGGLIRPGDFVDVILSVKIKPEGATPENNGSDQIAVTVAQNLKVLAIDQAVTAPTAETANADTAKKSNESAKTVTLAAPPITAEVLLLADTCRLVSSGRLAITARHLGDAAKMGTRSEWPDGPPATCAHLLGLSGLP